MAKRGDDAKASPFDALRIARLGQARPDVQMSEHLDSQTAGAVTGLAKSRDPGYVKFTTYVPRETHLRVKSLLVSQGRELSGLVAELLGEWLARQAALEAPERRG